MSRIGTVNFDPKNPTATSDYLTRLQKIVDSRIEFGNPLDPRTQGSTVLAGTGHNGTLMNIFGSWVEVKFEAVNTAVTFTHNLNIPVFNSEPNVRWLNAAYRHDGTGVVTGVETLTLLFKTGDTIGTNSIQLRLFAAAARTVSAAHPVTVSLFFIPANRMP